MPKKITVFADGTGNAFSHQESNVWRLYEALDQSQGDQIARYIPGVGTSDLRYWAKIDGATGIGVPANVRELYRFICWNWEPGDTIWMFGFSRGAFTIRALSGLIHSQGLMPSRVSGRLVSHETMQSNSNYAWRAYRRDKVKTPILTHPTVSVMRWALGQYWSRKKAARDFETAIEEIAGTDRQQPPIEMLGLFDTVEAYGVPIEELKPVIDRLIWPIRFREFRCGPQVKHVRHALALDDERTSFHPVRFDQRQKEMEEGKPRPEIKEVWFPGMHSDVGGGYPDDTLARVPLVWMAEEAKKLGLRLNATAIEHWTANASALGELHDSRAGAGVFYRYGPRTISATDREANTVVLHHSVVERMVHGSDNYAPLTLPSDKTEVLMPDGTQRQLLQPTSKPIDDKNLLGSQGSVTSALAVLKPPSSKLIDQAGDVVWWRRINYFVMLWTLTLIGLLPWIGGWIKAQSDDVIDTVGRLTGDAADGAPSSSFGLMKKWLYDGIGAIGTIWEWIAGFLPAIAEPWIGAMRKHPEFMLPLIAVAFLIYQGSQRLQKTAKDFTHEAWFNKGGVEFASDTKPWSLKLASFMRTNSCLHWTYMLLGKRVFPTAFAAILIFASFVIIHRVTLGAFTASGNVCSGETPKQFKWSPLPPGVTTVAAQPFTPASPCWPTGFIVEKGRVYSIWIEAEQPFADHLWVTPTQGFSGSGRWTHSMPFGLILKRWPFEAWFQPIYQIGARRLDEAPLTPVDGLPVVVLSAQDRLAEDGLMSTFLPWNRLPDPERSTAARRLGEVKRKPEAFEARITAKASGPLFLYVNDAMIGIPLYGVIRRFYHNNWGSAKVTIQQLVARAP